MERGHTTSNFGQHLSEVPLTSVTEIFSPSAEAHHPKIEAERFLKGRQLALQQCVLFL